MYSISVLCMCTFYVSNPQAVNSTLCTLYVCRHGLRRIDNSANMTAGVNSCPEPRSPSPDEFEEDTPPQVSQLRYSC